jgi:hypothetical protein
MSQQQRWAEKLHMWIKVGKHKPGNSFVGKRLCLWGKRDNRRDDLNWSEGTSYPISAI